MTRNDVQAVTEEYPPELVEGTVDTFAQTYIKTGPWSMVASEYEPRGTRPASIWAYRLDGSIDKWHTLTYVRYWNGKVVIKGLFHRHRKRVPRRGVTAVKRRRKPNRQHRGCGLGRDPVIGNQS